MVGANAINWKTSPFTDHLGCLMALACMPLAHAGIRASFWLSRCAWDATDIVELAIAPDEASFRVVAST
jgi:hypothetical protein